MDFHRRPGCPFQFLVRFSGSPLRIKHLKNSSHATSSAKSDQYSHTVQLKKRTIHTQKLAGSSPVVFAKKNLISREIRFFSLLFAYLQCPEFLVFLIDYRNTTDRKTPASAGVSFFAFMAAIRTLSFSSHSSGVWPQTFRELCLPSGPPGEYRPSQRWSPI